MLHQEAGQIMVERFGGDAVLALSTAVGNVPHARLVNAHFDDPDTIILRIRLTDGVLLSHGRRFEL